MSELTGALVGAAEPRNMFAIVLDGKVDAGFVRTGVPALALKFAATTPEQRAIQKDWLTNFVQDRLSTPERQIRLSNIEGALGSDVAIREITISDANGVWLRVNNA